MPDAPLEGLDKVMETELREAEKEVCMLEQEARRVLEVNERYCTRYTACIHIYTSFCVVKQLLFLN